MTKSQMSKSVILNNSSQQFTLKFLRNGIWEIIGKDYTSHEHASEASRYLPADPSRILIEETK